jgi:quercetin dioxygenase-like cupin family protein
MAEAPYSVRRVSVVMKGTDVLVREYELDPGEFIPWHSHTEVSDRFFGLQGTVLVETRQPEGRHELTPGATALVSPPTVHQVSNAGSGTCRFLLVQGVGKHDFVQPEKS